MNTNYKLDTKFTEKKDSPLVILKKLRPLIKGEEKSVGISFVAILINSALNLLAPYLIGVAIDTHIKTGNYPGLLSSALVIFLIYIAAFVANYIQIKTMGGVGQRLLFNLRSSVFLTLQELPVAFFNLNKTGDLISRINNDTDKLNQFFSQSLMQFVGNIFLIIGAGIALVLINPKLGLAALVPALLLIVVTQVLSPWIKKKNAVSLKAVGGLSAEIQESLNNFKVIVAFNRRDYFRKRFQEVNESTFMSAVTAGIANTLFTPIYGLSTNLAQLIVLTFGMYLILQGQFTIGLLVSFISYVNRLYDPLRMLASLWASFQLALASWDRVSDILSLNSDLPVLSKGKTQKTKHLLSFKDVSFKYPDGKLVLKDVNFNLESGKTYALVGPTGGGKTTTASLMARLYDPTKGTVYLEGRDIRSYEATTRTQKIGFILQEPILFTGTLKDNILYGDPKLRDLSDKELMDHLSAVGLGDLITRFEKGLETNIVSGGETMSLGQKQLIAFVRAVLRKPDILILDEATANIDTITEQVLEEILMKLPKSTTKVIIAHRLNTIENADEIFFVNGGEVTRAGSLKHAIEMLTEGKRSS